MHVAVKRIDLSYQKQQIPYVVCLAGSMPRPYQDSSSNLTKGVGGYLEVAEHTSRDHAAFREARW